MFIEDVQKLPKLDEFQGGNVRQRQHLNTIILAWNSMVDAANRDDTTADEQKLDFTVVANGSAVDVVLFGYVADTGE